MAAHNKAHKGEARNRTFASRDDRAFWRGSIRTQPECADEMGNFARTQAVALSARHPSLFDVRCLDCDVRDEATKPCDAYKFDADTKKVIDGTCEAPRAAHRQAALQSYQYKYQLNLRGSVSGSGASSYSRNLNHLWSVREYSSARRS